MRDAYEYDVGDRVVALGDNWYDVSKGDKGTVISIYDTSNIGVEWYRYVGGHSCDGIGKTGFCTWEIPYKIDLMDSTIKDEESSAVLQDCEELI